MKKLISVLSVALCLCILLTACHSSFSYTFNIETGDRVKVTLDTTNGYKLRQENGQFSVEKDDNKLMFGTFLTADMFDDYEATVLAGADIIESAEDFYLFQQDGQSGRETYYLFMLDNSDTGIILATLEGEETARAIYDLLTITANPED